MVKEEVCLTPLEVWIVMISQLFLRVWRESCNDVNSWSMRRKSQLASWSRSMTTWLPINTSLGWHAHSLHGRAVARVITTQKWCVPHQKTRTTCSSATILRRNVQRRRNVRNALWATRNLRRPSDIEEATWRSILPNGSGSWSRLRVARSPGLWPKGTINDVKTLDVFGFRVSSIGVLSEKRSGVPTIFDTNTKWFYNEGSNIVHWQTLCFIENGMFRPQLKTSPWTKERTNSRTDGIENSVHKLVRFQHRKWIQKKKQASKHCATQDWTTTSPKFSSLGRATPMSVSLVQGQTSCIDRR